MPEMNSWFKKDDIYLNAFDGFDYSFCGSDCKNVKCARNFNSESYKTVARVVPVHTVCDFHEECINYIKPKEDKDD